MKNEQVEKKIITKNNQPIKEITYQDIFKLGENIERLLAWEETLTGISEFFSEKDEPLNKKRVIKEFRVNAQIFTVFYQQFLTTIQSMEKEIGELKQKKKLKLSFEKCLIV